MAFTMIGRAGKTKEAFWIAWGKDKAKLWKTSITRAESECSDCLAKIPAKSKVWKPATSYGNLHRLCESCISKMAAGLGDSKLKE